MPYLYKLCDKLLCTVYTYIHVDVSLHICSIYAELREEDNADKPNEYIETCIGRSEPLAKVSDK